jgi:hypothetical protein
MRGRPGDWGATVAGKPAAEVVASARSEGFRGLLLDRAVFGDRAPAVDAEYRSALGEPALTNGRYSFWRL